MVLQGELAALCFLMSSFTTLAASSTEAPHILHPRQQKVSFIAWPAMHTIKLKCKSNGSEPLQYRWLKDGKPMHHRKLQPFIKTNQWFLRIRELVVSDNGEYTCVVSNPYGQVNHTYTLRVVSKPRSRPILKCGYPQNTTALPHSKARLRCIVSISGVLPDFRWIHWNKIPKNYEKLDLNNRHYKVISPIHYATIDTGNQEEYGSELRLNNLSEKDFGLYTCIASNHLGMDYRSAFLNTKISKTASKEVDAHTITTMLKHRTTKRPSKGTKPSDNVNVEQLASSSKHYKEPRVPISIFIGTLGGIAFLLTGFLLWFHFNHKKKGLTTKDTLL